jgi:hypothetical protein
MKETKGEHSGNTTNKHLAQFKLEIQKLNLGEPADSAMLLCLWVFAVSADTLRENTHFYMLS